MKLFKTLAVYAAALLSPLGGHVGPGLVAAVSSAVTAEDSKEGGSVSTLQITDMVLTDETELTWGDGQTKRVRSIVIVAGTERWSELHHELIPSWSAPSIQLLSCGLDRLSFLPFPTLEPMCRGF